MHAELRPGYPAAACGRLRAWDVANIPELEGGEWASSKCLAKLTHHLLKLWAAMRSARTALTHSPARLLSQLSCELPDLWIVFLLTPKSCPWVCTGNLVVMSGANRCQADVGSTGRSDGPQGRTSGTREASNTWPKS